jgi:hypothetical protein
LATALATAMTLLATLVATIPVMVSVSVLISITVVATLAALPPATAGVVVVFLRHCYKSFWIVRSVSAWWHLHFRLPQALRGKCMLL